MRAIIMGYAAMLNGPAQIALAFCGRYDPAMRAARTCDDVTSRVRSLIAEVEKAANAPVTLVDTGKYLDDFIQMTE